jgi:hypothetical protein
MMTVIVVGPQGCGKSQLAQQMLTYFSCTQLVDPWEGQTLPAGSLVLTNCMGTPPEDAVILSFDEAKELMGLADWTPAT